MTVLFNDGATRDTIAPPLLDGPLRFHRRLPGYAPTPLVELPTLAAELGVGRIFVKDESNRLGLPAFKVLGASWAVYRELAERLGREPGPWSTLEDLARCVEPIRPLELRAATDGNHGRSVARVASWLGFEAKIFVPQGTARARIESIEREGASVTEVPGTYDDAVREAAARTGPRSLLIQDSAWPGYERIPERVVEGYSTMFREIDRQIETEAAGAVDLVFVQIGVGSLAAAAARHYRAEGRDGCPKLVGVEPVDAACALASLERGRPAVVPGPHRSMMAGLNCGTLSSVAWPWLRRGLDAAVAVQDSTAAEAVRRLAMEGLGSGESGAAGLAGLLRLLAEPGAERIRERLGLGPSTRVLLLSTEGVTDPENHRRLLSGWR